MWLGLKPSDLLPNFVMCKNCYIYFFIRWSEKPKYFILKLAAKDIINLFHSEVLARQPVNGAAHTLEDLRALKAERILWVRQALHVILKRKSLKISQFVRVGYKPVW